jgi:hypothetical protein
MQVVREIYRSLIEGIDGCTSQQHQAALHEHLTSEEDNHYDLGATYQDLQARISSEDILGLEVTDFPSNKGHPRRRYTNAKELELLFHGAEPDETPMNICLHAEPVKEGRPSIRFDIDSFFIFLLSLDALLRDFRYVPVSTTAFNITTNIHLKRQIAFTS